VKTLFIANHFCRYGLLVLSAAASRATNTEQKGRNYVLFNFFKFKNK